MDRLDLALVDVDARGVEAGVRELERERQPDVAEADDPAAGLAALESCRSDSCIACSSRATFDVARGPRAASGPRPPPRRCRPMSGRSGVGRRGGFSPGRVGRVSHGRSSSAVVAVSHARELAPAARPRWRSRWRPMKTAWFSVHGRAASATSSSRPAAGDVEQAAASRDRRSGRSPWRGARRDGSRPSRRSKRVLIERRTPSGRRSCRSRRRAGDPTRWTRARSRYVATPVANSTSLSIAPRTVRKRSARGFMLASRRSSFVGGRLVDQVELVDDQEVGRRDLRPGDLGLAEMPIAR